MKSFRPHAAARPLWWLRSRDGGSDQHELHRPSEIDGCVPEVATRGRLALFVAKHALVAVGFTENPLKV
jgi:hypothetical protein